MSNLDLLITFKNNLQHYSLEQLRYNSVEEVWSIGQMYDHLIVVAHEYIDNIEICAALNEEQPYGKTQFGEQLFKDGGFPPIKIRLPDELNSPPNNSDSKEFLIRRMEQLIQRMSNWSTKVDYINHNNKVEHGGFGWLNGKEWYELVVMHFRHHLLQKKELDSYLG